jgi:hypothetical protein
MRQSADVMSQVSIRAPFTVCSTVVGVYRSHTCEEEAPAMDVPQAMRAVRIAAHGGPEVLELVEVAVPSPREGEVMVQVSAVALNNTDL